MSLRFPHVPAFQSAQSHPDSTDVPVRREGVSAFHLGLVRQLALGPGVANPGGLFRPLLAALERSSGGAVRP